mgnify:CR=1 FL=1
MSWFRSFARFIVGMLVGIFFRCRVIGRQNIVSKGPIIVVANHPSLLDPPLVGTILRREAIFIAKDGLFKSRFNSWLLKALGAFPVNRSQLSREALKKAVEALNSNKVLVVFPEGGRSSKGQMKEALPGAAMLASRYGVPVLPVGVVGTEKVTGFTGFIRRHRISVIIGEPFYLPTGKDKTDREQLLGLTNMVMRRIAALLPEQYHGYYAERGQPVGTTN